VGTASSSWSSLNYDKESERRDSSDLSVFSLSSDVLEFGDFWIFGCLFTNSAKASLSNCTAFCGLLDGLTSSFYFPEGSGSADGYEVFKELIDLGEGSELEEERSSLEIHLKDGSY